MKVVSFIVRMHLKVSIHWKELNDPKTHDAAYVELDQGGRF